MANSRTDYPAPLTRTWLASSHVDCGVSSSQFAALSRKLDPEVRSERALAKTASKTTQAKNNRRTPLCSIAFYVCAHVRVAKAHVYVRVYTERKFARFPHSFPFLIDASVYILSKVLFLIDASVYILSKVPFLIDASVTASPF